MSRVKLPVPLPLYHLGRHPTEVELIQEAIKIEFSSDFT